MPTKAIIANKDVYIHSADPVHTFNNWDRIRAGTNGDDEARLFLKFHPSYWHNNIPAGSRVTSASLRLYADTNVKDKSSAPARVVANIDYWNENNINWRNHSSRSHSWLQRNFVVTANSFNEVNVTEWAARANNNNNLKETGLRIQSVPGASRFDLMEYRSTRWGATVVAPHVFVAYDAAPPPPPDVESSGVGDRFFVSGKDVVNDADKIQIFYSNSPSGSLTYAGNATVNSAHNSYNHSVGGFASSPNPPSFNNSSLDGNDVVLSWSSGSQPAISRWFTAKRVLSDGTTSNHSGVRGATIRPDLTVYTLERRRSGQDNWATIYRGSNRSYRDRNLASGYHYFYRISVENSQGRTSSFSTTSITFSTPPAPSFSSVEVIGNEFYRLSGNGVPAGSRVRVYYSGSGANYKLYDSFISSSTSFSRDVSVSVPKPLSPGWNEPVITENSISLFWENAKTPPSTDYFKISYEQDGVESHLSPARSETIFPQIASYDLQRKPAGQGDGQYVTIYTGTETSFTDTPQRSQSYTYRLRAINNHGLFSSWSVATHATSKPDAPQLFDPQVVLEEGGSVRISGSLRRGADKVSIERRLSTDSTWSVVGDALFNDLQGTEEWAHVDYPSPSKPNLITWGTCSVDSSGVHLRWKRPANPVRDYSYRARRHFGNVAGETSEEKNATIAPTVSGFRLQKRKRPPFGEEGLPQYEWQTVRDANVDAAQVNSYSDADVDFDTDYQYRILARNNWEEDGAYSAIKTFSTANAPPPPPEDLTEPATPLILSVSPTGITNIASAAPVRFSWEYDSNESEGFAGSSQSRFMLSFTPENDSDFYWDGMEWVSSPVWVNSSKHQIDVSPSVFSSNGTATLTVASLGGEESDPYFWEIEPALFITSYFDTRREVRREVSSHFDLYRKVTSFEGDDSYPLKVAWSVEKQMPFVADDEGVSWEGGGNAWPIVVYDRDGRPEPYAEVDFEKDGVTKTFVCDSRGRTVLSIPEDITPGIYTMRERGPSLSPRTTRNYAVYDPWVVYSHGHRHSASGPDPIFGITDEQISDGANIHPSKIAGGKALGEIVSAYGSNITENLEQQLSAGHGNYVVSGFSAYFIDADSRLHVSSGVCWESGRRRKMGNTENVLSDGVYKVYVYLDSVRVVNRIDYPPGSCPLYTLTVTGGTGTLQDDRIYHPPFGEVTKNIVPVRWGASSTEDLTHNDVPLPDILFSRLEEFDFRKKNEDDLRSSFFDENRRVEEIVRIHDHKRRRARETAVILGYASSLRYLYSLLGVDPDIQVPSAYGICAFRKEDRLSSLTNLKIENGIATLPDDWMLDKKYLLRTLRIFGPPARMLQFTLVYEDTGADMVVRGSLGNDGSYFPQDMREYMTVSDTIPIEKHLSETLVSEVGGKKVYSRRVERQDVPVKISTFRSEFEHSGREAVVEVAFSGGGDGVRLRGFFTNVA